MFKVNAISFQQAGGPLFKDLSFELEPASLTCIIGPNGSGKSTLLKSLTGFLPLKHGQVYYNSTNLEKLSRKCFAKHLAYLPQNIPHAPLTVYQTLLMGRTPYIKFMPSKGDCKKVETILEKFGLQAWKMRYLDELSGGERQKVFLLKILVQETPIIMLDEPASNLDIRFQLELYQTIKDLVQAEHKIVLIAEHNLNLAAQFSDQILLMNKCQLIGKGQAKDILTVELLKDVYQIEAKIQFMDSKPHIVQTKMLSS